MSTEDSKNLKSAPYPASSESEIDSKIILDQLLGAKYFRGEIKVMDKIPNVDGALEIIDDERRPVGKVEIQLKTLETRHAIAPRYSCELSLIAYSRDAILPVLLIVVDRAARKAYWRHLDAATQQEVISKAGDQQTYTLYLPHDHVIDGTNLDYLTAWRSIIAQERKKIKEYDQLEVQARALEEQLRVLQGKLETPASLPVPVLKDIHRFIDYYNNILDQEFPCVKTGLYHNYWKIGIGVIRFTDTALHFFLFPVAFNTSQTLVKTLTPEEFNDLPNQGFEWMVLNVLVVVTYSSADKLRYTPQAFAYDLLERQILQTLEKHNLPIEHTSLAHEYLISFIDHNVEYLGFSYRAEDYSLERLDYMLRVVLPMLEGRKTGYADWVTEFTRNIDTSNINCSAAQHQKKIEGSIEDVRKGFIPKVQVTISSSDYGIDLIYYYIELLRSQGETHARRRYNPDQRNKEMYGVDIWKTWYTDIVWHNFKILFTNFYNIYAQCLRQHFPALEAQLSIMPQGPITTLVVLQQDPHSKRPYIELFHLRGIDQPKEGIYFYTHEDAALPITFRQLYDQKRCTIAGVEYMIAEARTMNLKFMFDQQPTYALLKEILLSRVKTFLKEKEKLKR